MFGENQAGREVRKTALWEKISSGMSEMFMDGGGLMLAAIMTTAWIERKKKECIMIRVKDFLKGAKLDG